MILSRRRSAVIFSIGAALMAAASFAWACTTTADGSYITVTPARGPIGTDVTVRGTNWATTTSVHVVWAGTGATVCDCPVVNGSFTTSFTVQGPESSSNNTYYFQATQNGATSNAPFTVEATQSSTGNQGGGSGTNTTSGAEEKKQTGSSTTSTSGGSQTSGSGSASGSTSGSETSTGQGSTSNSTSGGNQNTGSGSSQSTTTGGSTSSRSGSASQSTSGGVAEDRQRQTSESSLANNYSDGWAVIADDVSDGRSASTGAVEAGMAPERDTTGSARADQTSASDEAPVPEVAPDGGGVFGDLWSGFTGEEVPSFGSDDAAKADDPFGGFGTELALSGAALMLLMSGFLVAELRRRRSRAGIETE